MAHYALHKPLQALPLIYRVAQPCYDVALKWSPPRQNQRRSIPPATSFSPAEQLSAGWAPLRLSTRAAGRHCHNRHSGQPAAAITGDMLKCDSVGLLRPIRPKKVLTGPRRGATLAAGPLEHRVRLPACGERPGQFAEQMDRVQTARF